MEKLYKKFEKDKIPELQDRLCNSGLSDEFITDAIYLIKTMTNRNPKARTSAKNLLQNAPIFKRRYNHDGSVKSEISEARTNKGFLSKASTDFMTKSDQSGEVHPYSQANRFESLNYHLNAVRKSPLVSRKNALPDIRCALRELVEDFRKKQNITDEKGYV